MITPDMLNAIFEGGLSLFIFKSVLTLHKDKIVRGIWWPMVAFTLTWGYFNLWFYPTIDQWWSFVAGTSVVTVNTIWLGQMLYYIRKENKFHVGMGDYSCEPFESASWPELGKKDPEPSACDSDNLSPEYKQGMW